MLRYAISNLVVCLVLAGAPARPDTAPDPRRSDLSPSERLEALLDLVRATHSELVTLEADFVQLKESGMLLEPSKSRGVFSYAAPDRVRWEYSTPDPISLVIAGDEMTTWYKDLERAELAEVGGHSDNILRYMGASTSIDKLLEYFTVTLSIPGVSSEPFRLLLEPRFGRVAKRVRELKVWIDGERYLPLRLRYVEGDGDVTEYHFENLRVNEDLPEDRFVLDLPQEIDRQLVQLEARAAGR
jgi:outer membrane lipoprotein carrier protein